MNAPRSRFFPPATVLRDLFVAPLTEELAFRGCLLPLLLLLLPPAKKGSSSREATALVFSSAAFACAHLHHAVASLLSPSLPLNQRRAVLLGAALQLLYTSAFGALAGALLLASGSLAAPVAAHSLANFLGLPRRSKSKSGNSDSLLLRRIEAAVGVVGIAAFAAIAAGIGGGEKKSVGGFVPFSAAAERFGAAGNGLRYRALAAALSPP